MSQTHTVVLKSLFQGWSLLTLWWALHIGTRLYIYTHLYTLITIYASLHTFIHQTPGISHWDRSLSKEKAVEEVNGCRYRCWMPELDVQLPGWDGAPGWELPAFLAAEFSLCTWSRCQLWFGPCLQPDSGTESQHPCLQIGLWKIQLSSCWSHGGNLTPFIMAVGTDAHEL